MHCCIALAGNGFTTLEDSASKTVAAWGLSQYSLCALFGPSTCCVSQPVPHKWSCSLHFHSARCYVLAIKTNNSGIKRLKHVWAVKTDRNTQRVKVTYRSPSLSHRCSLWDLHRRNRSTVLGEWDLHSLLLLRGSGPSCLAVQASTFCRQTTGGNHRLRF